MHIQWDHNKINEKIQQTYPKISWENLFFNYFFTWKKISTDTDIKIIDSTREKTFIISKKLIKKTGIYHILKLLFGTNKEVFKKLNKIQHIDLFGDKWNITYKEERIDSKEYLLKESIYINGYKKNIFHEYYSTYSYETGKYEEMNLFIENNNKGIDKNKRIAEKKAISEAIERVSGSLQPKKMETYTTKEDIISSPYIYQKEFIKKKKKIKYCKIKEIFWKNTALCPSEILFYPYKWIINSRKWNSNGMATHINTDQAHKNWVYEVIERDWFILMWLLKTGIYKITHTSLSQETKKIIQAFEKKGTKIHIFLIAFDNPVPICLVWYEKDQKTMFGLWIGDTIEISIQKALQEINENNYNITKKNIQKDIVLYHIRYYLQEKNRNKIQWLFQLKPLHKKEIESLYKKSMSLKKIIAYYKQKWITFFSYTYQNNINTIFNRKTIRIISKDMVPIWFWKWIPKEILQSKRMKQRKKEWNWINFDIHPLW